MLAMASDISGMYGVGVPLDTGYTSRNSCNAQVGSRQKWHRHFAPGCLVISLSLPLVLLYNC